MINNFSRMVDAVPKIYNPQFNRVIAALLTALAASDDEIATQIQNAHDQIFIRTAGGQNLDKAANSLGVSRPPTMGLSDEQFQELIPNLSLKPKQIRKAFYDTADVFWGPLFSRSNTTTLNFAPFNVSPGDVISVAIDAGPTQTLKVLSSDVASPGAATANEMVAFLSKLKGITVTILTDSLTGNQSLNMRTNTPGPVGSVQILPSTMITPTKMNFTVGLYEILDLPQRVAVYNFNPNELLIEIPAIVPALRRTLKGSHHFHTDGTLEPPEEPDNGIWEGSFFFNPSGSVATFTVTSQVATLEQTINRGDVLTAITVNDTSKIKNPSGIFTLAFGRETQEGPIKYRGVPNSNTILVDPGYVFRVNHSPGEVVNIIAAQAPYVPRTSGVDLAIYMTSPAGARLVAQGILDTLKAAGMVITFVVLAPKYRYLLDNPYLTTDDAPSIP